MLPPELDDGRAVVAIPVPDVDGIEARVARIESMVAEIHAVILPLQGMVQAVGAEMAEKGPVGMLGYLMSAMNKPRQ